MRNIFLNIFFFIFICLFLLFDISFLHAFSSLRLITHLALAPLIYAALVWNFKKVLICSLGIGFVQDMFSVFGIGVFTVTYVLIIVCVHYLFHQFITNKSLYSLIILIIVATLLFWIFMFMFSQFFLLLHISNTAFEIQSIDFRSIVWQAIFNVFFGAFLYYFLRAVNKRFMRIKNF